MTTLSSFFYSFLIPVDFAAEMMLINNCKKCSLKCNGGCWQVFKIDFFFALLLYSRGIWVAASGRFIHLKTPKRFATHCQKMLKLVRLPKNFASLIHQGVSYYTKKLRHFKTQKSQSITMLYLHVKINPSVVNYRK